MGYTVGATTSSVNVSGINVNSTNKKYALNEKRQTDSMHYEEIDYSDAALAKSYSNNQIPENNFIDFSKLKAENNSVKDYLFYDVEFQTDGFSKFDLNEDSRRIYEEVQKLEREIAESLNEINQEISTMKQKIAVANREHKPKDYVDSLKIKLEELEDKKQTLEEEIKLKKQLINYLKDTCYSNLNKNLDFNSKIEVNITSEESEELAKIFNFIASSTYSDKFYDYDTIKTTLEKNNMDKDINWDLVKSAYDKGFTIFDLILTSTNLLKSDAVSNVSAASNADGEYTFAEYAHIFSFMTDEERKVAMYLLKKFGTDSVKDYFNVKLQEINSRDGLSEALKVLENLDSTSGEEIIQELIKLGITDGVGTFFEGLGNATGGIDGITSAHQFKIMYIASWLSEEDPSKLNYLSEEIKQAVIELRKIASEEVRKGAYEISSSIGNMLPAIAVSTASSIVLTPAGGNKLGAVLMGLSAGGNAAENMYQQGFSFQESVTYGVMSGSSEAALGYFLGKIPGLSKMDDIPGLKNFFSDMLSEGREEFYQAILDPCFKSIVTGTKLNINWNEAIKSGIYGMITAGIMNSGEMVVDSVTGVTIEVDSLSTETIETIALLEEAGVEVDYTRIPEVGYIESLTEFLDDDITELKLESATVADWANTWSEFELSDWIHDCFDNIFGSKVIDKYVLSRIHKLSVEDYVELCKQHETTPQKTLGFVDKQHNLYLPENASMHTACHESLHLVSELNKMFKGQIIYDSEGNPHKVTGILEYYQNALKSKMANESLTDYLSSKYSDGKKYNTAYVDYVGYWEKLDNVLFEVYGENGSDLLLNTYLSNDTTFLRSFFDTYAGEGSYDRFVLSMENEMSEMYKEMDLTYRLKEINNIMSTIEYNVYKENHPIAHKIKSIFGGK